MTHLSRLGKAAFIILAGIGVGLLSPTNAWAQQSSANPESQPVAATDQSPAAELALWNEIKDSAKSEDFLVYLNRFPNGMFFDPAKTRYEELSGRPFVPDPGTASDTASGQEPSPPKVSAPVEPEVKQSPPKRKAVAKKDKRKKVAAKRTKLTVGKVKKRTASVTDKPKLKKKVAKPTRRALAKVAKPRKATPVANRQTCNTNIVTPGCPTPAVKRTYPVIRTRAGGGGSGGGGGGGGGGWGG